MANKPNFYTVIRDDYTGEEVELSAKSEEELDKKVNAQFEKWNGQQHIEEMKDEVEQRTADDFARNDYLGELHKRIKAINPERYYERTSYMMNLSGQ